MFLLRAAVMKFQTIKMFQNPFKASGFIENKYKAKSCKRQQTASVVTSFITIKGCWYTAFKTERISLNLYN